MIDPWEILAWNSEAAALVGPDGQHHGTKALLVKEIINGKVFSQFLIEFDLHACPFDVLDFFVQDISGKTILWNSNCHPTACDGQFLKHRDRITPLGQSERSGQSRRTRADDSHLLILRPFQLLRGPRFFHLMISHETFCHADGNRFIDIAAPAFVLTEGRADPATGQGKGVPFPMDLQGLGITSLSDQGDIRRDIDLCWTGIDAPSPNKVFTGACRTFPVENMSPETPVQNTAGLT